MNQLAKPDTVTCVSCGTVWKLPKPDSRDTEKRKRQRNAWWTADDGSVHCRDVRSCRSRKLANDLKLDLFARLPRERLLHLADRRPEDWQQTAWKPVMEPEQRVMAAIILHSWCFPVSMEYAVQTFYDEDGKEQIQLDQMGQAERITHRWLADWIGLDHSVVTRAISKLVSLHLLRVEDSRLYPIAKPSSLTWNERQGLGIDSGPAGTQSPTDSGGEFGALPPRLRAALAEILASSPPQEYSRIKEGARDVCERFNAAIRELRKERDLELAQILKDGETSNRGACTAPEPAADLGACTPKNPANSGACTPVDSASPGACTGGAILLIRPREYSESRPREYSESERACVLEASSTRTQDPATMVRGQSERQESNLGPNRPNPPKAQGQTPAETLYAKIPAWQDQHPGTRFSLQRFTLAKADRSLVRAILEHLGDCPISEYIAYVETCLSDRDQSPERRNHKLGILIAYAQQAREKWKAEAPLRQKLADQERRRAEQERASLLNYARDLLSRPAEDGISQEDLEWARECLRQEGV